MLLKSEKSKEFLAVQKKTRCTLNRVIMGSTLKILLSASSGKMKKVVSVSSKTRKNIACMTRKYKGDWSLRRDCVLKPFFFATV